MSNELLEEKFASTSLGLELVRKTEKDLSTFSELLDSLATVDERVKLLWKQIYENALTDRRNAYMVWSDLYMAVHGNPEQHVIHGDHLSKYMERITRSNDQILKLADLVYKTKEKAEKDEIPSSNDIFSKLERMKNY